MPERMKPRSVKVDDDLWDTATKEAAERGTTLAFILRRALREFVESCRKDKVA